MLNTEQARALLARQCKDAGGLRCWADQNHIAVSYVSQVLARRLEPGKKILDVLGLQRVIRYQKIHKKSAKAPA